MARNGMWGVGTLLLAAGMALVSPPAQAGNRQLIALMEVLVENGTLTRAQFEMLKAAALEADQQEQEAREAVAEEARTAREAAQRLAREQAHVTTNGGLKVKSGDGRHAFSFGGRIQADLALYHDDRSEMAGGTEFRRVQLESKGRIDRDWGYKASFDFADNAVEIKSLSLSYSAWTPFEVTVGQFGAPFSLEETTSSRHITFMERGLPNAFIPDDRLGVRLNRHGEAWSLALALFGESAAPNGNNDDEAWGGSGRITFAPLLEKRRVVHLGASGAFQTPPDGTGAVRYRARPETHVDGRRFVDTGNVTAVSHTLTGALEAALVWDRLSLQGEWMGVDVTRDNGTPDVAFSGYYAYASWFLTGESRPYEVAEGSFGRVTPRARFGLREGEGWGAWEVAARYSHLDLTDGPVRGGELGTITLGLNWHPTSQVRLMANTVWIDSDQDAATAPDDDPLAFQLRFQVDF